MAVAVAAKHFCGHAEQSIRHVESLAKNLAVQQPCEECQNAELNWTCLQCGVSLCGTGANAHMLQHFKSTGHSICVSYDDLSFWCYSCDSYLHHLTIPQVWQAYEQLHLLKFGEEPSGKPCFAADSKSPSAAAAAAGGAESPSHSAAAPASPAAADADDAFAKFFRFPEGLDLLLRTGRRLAPDTLSKYCCSAVRALTPTAGQVADLLARRQVDVHTLRGMGAVLGLVCGDSLGAPLEFSAVRYGSDEVRRMGQPDVWTKRGYNRFRLRAGQWTDDASMSLCMADSLLTLRAFDPKDMRLRFLLWWRLGYNNAFGNDVERAESYGCNSVGLGGNISESFDEFASRRTDYTTAGDLSTSGNGSIMRLAPVPVFFAPDVDAAMRFSYLSSKTTHQGDEAAECCRLLAALICAAIAAPAERGVGDHRATMDAALAAFSSPLYSVQCLASSQQEQRHKDNARVVNLGDRDWNWKNDEFRYSSTRAREQPGYIGSYCMDGLSMALHCVWSTNTFEAALLKAANMRGDADTVAAITGQIAGALYGYDQIPEDWLRFVQRWDNGLITQRAYHLATASAASQVAVKC